jgi:hypothetical protein
VSFSYPLVLGVALAVIPSAALAQAAAPTSSTPKPKPTPTAASSPSPTPSPKPTPAPGTFVVTGESHATFISSASSGPGVLPAEGPGFAKGSPLSPESPYDVFSSAPLVSGDAGESALYLHPTYYGKAFDVSLTLGVGYATGSMTNAAYWGEPLFETINPHLGSQLLPYRVAFPTHAGQDDGSAFATSLLSGRISTKDGALALRAGWFDLAQSDAFTFVQPAVTNVAPSIGVATAETLGDGPPNLDAWTPSDGVLPLHGVDLVAKHGLASAELTDATLPSLPGTSARLDMGSIVIDHGEGTRYSFDVVHVSTGGDPVPTTILFGSPSGTPVSASPLYSPCPLGTPAGILCTPQGQLPSTMIGGQQQTIFGARATFHITRSTDGIVEIGRSTYNAQDVAEPGTSHPGAYYHVGAIRKVGPGSLSLDAYKNGAYYATAILPYGAPENIWSVAWSWPGQWLKSNYQLINDFPVNVDRQGYRLKYVIKKGPFDLRISYGNFGQITPITYANALTTGFVDGFFLPQANNAATLGRQHQYGLYAAWHPAIGDFSFDYDEDTMHRGYDGTATQDYVSYDTPSYVLSYSRHLSSNLMASLSYDRYAMRGSFAQVSTNVNFAQRGGILGVEWAMTSRASLLASVRRSVFTGVPTFVGGPSPDFTNTMLTIEQRYMF